MADRLQTVPHRRETHTVAPSATSQAKGKSKAEAQDQTQVVRNVFKWEFGFSW
jgi:hypothetical protein